MPSTAQDEKAWVNLSCKNNFLGEQQHIMENSRFIFLLAILGEADAIILNDLAGIAGAQESLAAWDVGNGRFRLPPIQQQKYLQKLESTDSQQFRALHEKALRYLSKRLKAGEHRLEFIWDGVFERLASRLYANDRPAFQALLKEIKDIPLQTPVAQQRRLFYQGGVGLVQDDYGRALTIFDQLLTQEKLVPIIQARALNARALIYRLTGQLEDAKQGYQHSLALWQQLGNQYYEGMVLMNMGIVAYELRDYTSADANLRQAESIFSEIKSAHWLAAVQNELGLIQRDLGHWDKALSYFGKFIEQGRRDKADHHVGLGLLNIGEVLLFQGRTNEAIAALIEADQLLRTKLYAVDVYLYLALAYQAIGDLAESEKKLQQALNVAETIGRQEILPHVYYHLGDVRFHQGDVEAAEQAWIQAVEIIEETRRPLRNEEIKISLLGRWQQVYEALVLHFLSQDQVQKAFNWTERARARAFAETVSEGERPFTPTLEKVQSILPEDVMLIVYFTTGVLEQDIPMLRQLAQDNPLRKHLLVPAQTILFSITKSEINALDCNLDPNLLTSLSPRRQFSDRILQPSVCRKLYQILLGNISAISNQEQLIVIPHGPLHQVSFNALMDENGNPLIQPGGPTVTFAPSVTMYLQSRPRLLNAEGNHTCLAVGYGGRGNGRYLHYTKIEVNTVAKLMRGNAWHEGLYIEKLREKAATCQWLHIACHGWFNQEDPLSSYLEIGSDSRLTARDVLQNWQLQARLVTLSACQTGVSHILRGDEPMGLIRAFLGAGAQAVLVTQWPVADFATFLLMTHFYQTMQEAKQKPAAALHAAQCWLKEVTVNQIFEFLSTLPEKPLVGKGDLPPEHDARPFEHPRFWAAFTLVSKLDLE